MKRLVGNEMRASARYGEALTYATALHAKQIRKGTQIPYITHPIAVSEIVIAHGGDEDEAIAALLHDGPEDQGGLETLMAIRGRFGDRVGDIVEGCTDTFLDPKPEWRTRKEKYLAALPAKNKSVLLVSAADKLHNATCIRKDYQVIGEALWERFTTGKDGQLWYYRALVDVYRVANPIALVDRLDQVVSEFESLARGKELK